MSHVSLFVNRRPPFGPWGVCCCSMSMSMLMSELRGIYLSATTYHIYIYIYHRIIYIYISKYVYYISHINLSHMSNVYHIIISFISLYHVKAQIILNHTDTIILLTCVIFIIYILRSISISIYHIIHIFLSNESWSRFLRSCCEAWALLQNAMNAEGNELFTPSRWTKVGPALRHWARGLALHQVLKTSYLQSDVLVDCKCFACCCFLGKGGGQSGWFLSDSESAVPLSALILTCAALVPYCELCFVIM